MAFLLMSKKLQKLIDGDQSQSDPINLTGAPRNLKFRLSVKLNILIVLLLTITLLLVVIEFSGRDPAILIFNDINQENNNINQQNN